MAADKSQIILQKQLWIALGVLQEIVDNGYTYQCPSCNDREQCSEIAKEALLAIGAVDER